MHFSLKILIFNFIIRCTLFFLRAEKPTAWHKIRKCAVFYFIKLLADGRRLDPKVLVLKESIHEVESSVSICWGRFETTKADYSLWERVHEGAPTQIKATSSRRCLAYFVTIPLDPTVRMVSSRTSFPVSTRRWDVTTAEFEFGGPAEHAGFFFFLFLTQIQDDRPRRHSDCRCAALPTRCPNLSKVKRRKHSLSKDFTFRTEMSRTSQQTLPSMRRRRGVVPYN